ncbi:hypothetical protein [Actinoplanes sp. N902-109]|uniref:hypothetical protein n=1 Tax=Actinoplanes sp. (strain N902-109) TaxID=649831 RepID=UPI000329397E|nr:hypothetical protein [Actinoplanes sp. N902-109]AGL18155.1 hypothetical protein L083_4645 [Actinoplanes sp. N902-109]
MNGFVRQFVDYCQYQVRSAPYWRTGMGIYLAGDSLLHVSSPTECTGFAATHTGWIELRVVIRDSEPVQIPSGWDAVSELTLWCPRGVLSVHSMMGSTADEFAALSVPPGLLRVRAHARNRIDESTRTAADPPEQHELVVWPVTEETGPATLRTDGTRPAWAPQRDKAAEYAMLDVIRPYDAHEERDPELPRVTVVRRLPTPTPSLAGRLPVGDREVHLTRTGEHTLEWRWVAAGAALPDDRAGVVRIDGRTLRHEGVIGRHAVMLGLIWDHLLTKAPDAPPVWEPVLQARAAEERERAERTRRLRAQQEASAWGGSAPTERLRVLSGHAQALARLDRRLLDRLAALPADRQRTVAVWAARRALRVAGLDQVDWIAAALEAVEAGGPLPAGLTGESSGAASRRVLFDPGMPHTTVTLPGGPPNFSQQALAFPALLVLSSADPLAAAVDAVYTTAMAHGADGYAAFLADVPLDDD